MKKITTVILAAGKSSRFKSNKSKIFQELAGIPIIEHVYNIAKKISNNNIIFVCNENNIKFLQKKFINCKFVLQKNQKGTADAVLSSKKLINDSNILILFGDVPLISIRSVKKLIKDFKNNKMIGSILTFYSKNPYGYGRVVKDKIKVLSIVEEINASTDQKNIKLCNSGVMICNSELLFKNINKIKDNNKKKEKYLPDIFEIFNIIGKSFTYVVCDENEMLGVNTISDFIKIDQIYQNTIKDKLIKSGVIILEPHTVRLSHDTKIFQGSIIEPFVIVKTGVNIKKDVKIKSHSILESCIIGNGSSIGPAARIRPFSKIGNQVKIGNYVEIKNSQIGDKSSISHLSYIGDSKLGNNVNIGAGTITCNYDGKKKNITKIEDNVFVGSNCSLVAPIKIGKNSTIGAGSVITKNIPSNYLAIERSKIKFFKKPRKE